MVCLTRNSTKYPLIQTIKLEMIVLLFSLIFANQNATFYLCSTFANSGKQVMFHPQKSHEVPFRFSTLDFTNCLFAWNGSEEDLVRIITLFGDSGLSLLHGTVISQQHLSSSFGFVGHLFVEYKSDDMILFFVCSAKVRAN